jgi:hypothetical protein
MTKVADACRLANVDFLDSLKYVRDFVCIWLCWLVLFFFIHFVSCILRVWFVCLFGFFFFFFFLLTSALTLLSSHSQGRPSHDGRGARHAPVGRTEAARGDCTCTDPRASRAHIRRGDIGPRHSERAQGVHVGDMGHRYIFFVVCYYIFLSHICVCYIVSHS